MAFPMVGSQCNELSVYLYLYGSNNYHPFLLTTIWIGHKPFLISLQLLLFSFANGFGTIIDQFGERLIRKAGSINTWKDKEI